MCLICIDFQRGGLNPSEAYRNLREMAEGMTDEHYDEVVSMLIDSITSEQLEADSEDNFVDLIEGYDNTFPDQLAFDWSDITEELELNDPLEIPWGNDYYGSEG